MKPKMFECCEPEHKEAKERLCDGDGANLYDGLSAKVAMREAWEKPWTTVRHGSTSKPRADDEY